MVQENHGRNVQASPPRDLSWVHSPQYTNSDATSTRTTNVLEAAVTSKDEDDTSSNYDSNEHPGNLDETSSGRLDAESTSDTTTDVSDTLDDEIFNAGSPLTRTSSTLSRRVGEVAADTPNNLEVVLPPEAQPILPEHVQLNRVQDLGYVLDELREHTRSPQWSPTSPSPRRSSRQRKLNPKVSGDLWK